MSLTSSLRSDEGSLDDGRDLQDVGHQIVLYVCPGEHLP
jgi:hypothetical protein